MRYVWPVVAGSAAGLVVGLAVWAYARSRLEKELAAGGALLGAEIGTGRAELEARLAAGRAQLEAQVRSTVAREVPPVVDSSIRTTLSAYGLTPDNTRRIVSAANYVLSLGG